jgi:hypothetical protein
LYDLLKRFLLDPLPLYLLSFLAPPPLFLLVSLMIVLLLLLFFFFFFANFFFNLYSFYFALLFLAPYLSYLQAEQTFTSYP